MKFKKYSNGAWTDAPYYIMKNGSWTSTTDVHEMDNGAWLPISGWDGFRNLVRSGTASSLYPIGTELYETWGDNTSNAWIIVDYDNSDYMDPDLTLQGYTHNVILMEKNITQKTIFENQQAFISFIQSVSAKKVRVEIPAITGSSYYGTYAFSKDTTTTVDVGGQAGILFKYKASAPSNVYTYASPHTSTASAVFNGSSGSDGTYLGKIKTSMSDTDSSYGQMNYFQRCCNNGTSSQTGVLSGSNNYYQSSLRQWINATTETNWWTPGCVFTRPPTSMTSLPGKLYSLNSDMKSVLATPTIPCRTNNVFETGSIGETPFALDTAYTVRDKMFIPSHTELNLSISGAPTIGSTWSYFTTNAQTKRVRTYNGTATDYWTRSAISANAYQVYSVGSGGSYGLQHTNTSTPGVVCACTIQ